MGSVLPPYLAALTVIGYRWYKVGQPPPPIRLIGVTAIMGGCAILGEANPKFGQTLAWGFVLAAAIGPGVVGNVNAVTWTVGAPTNGAAGQASTPLGNPVNTPSQQAAINTKLNRQP